MLVTVGYAGVGGYFYFAQHDMLYEGATTALPTKIEIAKAAKVGLVPWTDTTPGAGPLQGYVLPNFKAPTPRGTIVFFHGNGESAWLWVDHVAPLTQRGFRVFLYEYPGFGGRTGSPCEKTIVPDARALIRSLDKTGYGPIYVWGESLGSGVAAAVCGDETLPVHGLTLVTAWDNLANVGLSYYPFLPVRLFMIDKYDSIANLEHFQHPICVIRGDEDTTIYPPLTLNLYAHLPNPKKMILMKGYGHGDWPGEVNLPWWDDALDFIAPRVAQ